jgi:hypothetical protein
MRRAVRHARIASSVSPFHPPPYAGEVVPLFEGVAQIVHRADVKAEGKGVCEEAHLSKLNTF